MSKKMGTFLISVMLICGVGTAAPRMVIGEEQLFQEDFERADSLLVGNGWKEVFSAGSCREPGPAREPSRGALLFGGRNGPATGEKVNDPLKTEIDAELVDARRRPIKSQIQPEATAELQEGQLFLHFQENQASQMVQRDINKRVTRISYDYTPLYAMGGVDDRAWFGVRVFFLDHNDRILGEIRNFYYNVQFDEVENSDTVHTVTFKGPFDGALRHSVIDVKQILHDNLTGVNPDKISKTRLSIEISSNICGSSVEGYLDNFVSTMVDPSGLYRFSRDEMLNMIRIGSELLDSDPKAFPTNWIDSLVATYGRKKLALWLHEIPQALGSNPAKLAALMGDLFHLDGKNAFVVAYGVSILLYHF